MKDKAVPFNPLLAPDLSARLRDLVIEVVREDSVMARAEVIQAHIPDARVSLDLETQRFRSSLLLLRDLINQGWDVGINVQGPFLHHPKVRQGWNAKQAYREALLTERSRQLQEPSVGRFVASMERPRRFGDRKVSIRNLVADPRLLIDGLEASGASAVQPYLQIIHSNRDRDSSTGLRLLDIWRYFRLTWSLPYKATPGRNLFFLIRDRGQPDHPIMGIAALGNSIVQITCRDDKIGWTLDSLRRRAQTMDDQAADLALVSLRKAVRRAISNIRWDDLLPAGVQLAASIDVLEALKRSVEQADRNQPPKRVTADADAIEWEELSETPLYRRKRASALEALLRAERVLADTPGDTPSARLQGLLATSAGRSALSQALHANKKEKIGTNMMDIIVCGAVPPYNHLLAGKLAALLMMSPEVSRTYSSKYCRQVSVIASGMKGQPVMRNAHLVYLGTTSLYETGSSQYNRVFIPSGLLGPGSPPKKIEYEVVGLTKGYGTVYLSDETVDSLSDLILAVHGNRLVHNTYGEGTSPRLRLVKAGLALLGLPSDDLTRHNYKRIVYGIELASNSLEYLRGEALEPKYYFDSDRSPDAVSQSICDYWRSRWLAMRLNNQEVIQRLREFRPEELLLGHTMLT